MGVRTPRVLSMRYTEIVPSVVGESQSPEFATYTSLPDGCMATEERHTPAATDAVEVNVPVEELTAKEKTAPGANGHPSNVVAYTNWPEGCTATDSVTPVLAVLVNLRAPVPGSIWNEETPASAAYRNWPEGSAATERGWSVVEIVPAAVSAPVLLSIL